MRNYIPSYQWALKGGWNIADCVERSYDVEGMHVGTVAAGRIGLAVLRRLKPFDMHLHCTDRHRLPEQSRGSSNSRGIRMSKRWSRFATSCRSTRRFIRKPKASSTTSFSLK